MTHPARDQWLEYLYGELDTVERLKLKAHLHVCEECKAVVEQWRATGSELDEWRVTLPAKRPAVFTPVFKWAMAAVVVLTLGLGLGRLSASYDVERVRAAVEPEIRAQLRSELAQIVGSIINRRARSAGSQDEAKLAPPSSGSEQTKALIAESVKTIEAQRKADNQAIFAALNESDSRRIAEFFLLKKELDTVAQNTALGLGKTERQLIQLANYTQPNLSSNSPAQ